MWPFRALKRARYKRRYQAAWTLLLARYTYSKLPPVQQIAVRARDSQYLVACGDAYALFRDRNSKRFRPDYVIAMKSLGIPPALEGESWTIPDDVDMPLVARDKWGRKPRGRIPVIHFWRKLTIDYQASDPATIDAHRDLALRGIEIPLNDPNGLEDIHHIEPDGRLVTWREYWRNYPKGHVH